MELLPEPSGVFNPSVLQRDVAQDDDNDQEQEDADEMRDIAEGIDNQLNELDGDDLELEEEGDLAAPSSFASQGVNFESTGYREKEFLTSASRNDALQILYEARGHQIQKLQREVTMLRNGQEQATRAVRHEVALLKGQKETLSSRVEHLTSVADGQVEENRNLRDQVEQLQQKLDVTLKSRNELTKELDSSNLMVKTLQSQVIDMQKSDTILQAKQHHDQSVKSLRERHELEIFKFQQEREKLQFKLKAKDNEVDVLRGKVTKTQREHDYLLVEKSETIRGLQERLDASERKLSQYISENASMGYANVKAMQQRYQRDQQKYVEDVFGFSEEINQLKDKLETKEGEIANTNQRLSELATKYQKLKEKARLFKTHVKAKEEKYVKQIQSNEDGYRERLLGLRSKMEDAYNCKEKQIETELMIMKEQFNEELARALRIDADENFFSERDDDDVGSRSEKLIPNGTKDTVAVADNFADARAYAVCDLNRIFETAKTTVRHELKKPSDNF